MKNLFQIILFVPLFIMAQEKTYVNEISGVNKTWHQIELTNNVLNKVQADFSDIRIISVTESKDTSIVPYFVNKPNTWKEKKGINFKIINRTKKDSEYYFTFKLLSLQEINEIILNFKQENFNWELNLEASQDNKKWFEILSDYRILAIKNNNTDYQFTSLKIPKSEYLYYRISFKSDKKPLLRTATLQKTFEREAKFNEVESVFTNDIINKKQQQKITISLKNRLPISLIDLSFEEQIDYQRAIRIEYLVDSFNTEKGWKYNYSTIKNSYVSSLGENKFYLDAIYTNKFLITIYNNDNQALVLNDIKISRLKYYLTARFLQQTNKHYITYGDWKKRAPVYDIVNFKKKIPKELEVLELKEQVTLVNGKKVETNPVVTKWWLWAIIVLIVAVLGYSSISMLKKKD